MAEKNRNKSFRGEKSKDNYTLHELFRVVGDQLTAADVKVMKFLYRDVVDKNEYKVFDGYTFFLAMEKCGKCDESNFKHLLHLLRIITRHDLTEYVRLRRRKTVQPDPVVEYLEASSSPKTVQDAANKPSTSTDIVTCSPQPDTSIDFSPPAKRTRLARSRGSKIAKLNNEIENSDTKSTEKDEIRKKVTCDIRLRVRAEYCHHDSALEGNIFSNKPELVERQFEKFSQANTILKSRDLGSIICDIKFSELTYLDAFWRDYINGSLLEALKGVFITESLKQAVGHEAIKLLVNVDEDDYEAGRLKLLQNLTD